MSDCVCCSSEHKPDMKVGAIVCVECVEKCFRPLASGLEPTYAKLLEIWGGMVNRVEHQENCQDPRCKHDDDPPSYYETSVVREWKRTTR